jgi:hypothetical protein
MQIFEFELIEPTVTAPEAAIAPILAFARAAEREHLLEHEELARARYLNLAASFHRFVSGAAEATSRQSWAMRALRQSCGRRLGR